MTPYLDMKRSEEILEWLNINSKVYNIESFVILDDDKLEPSDELSNPYLDLHLVKTTWEYGLEDKHIQLAIDILNRLE